VCPPHVDVIRAAHSGPLGQSWRPLEVILRRPSTKGGRWSSSCNPLTMNGLIRPIRHVSLGIVLALSYNAPTRDDLKKIDSWLRMFGTPIAEKRGGRHHNRVP
jgi:hypothetical protein